MATDNELIVEQIQIGPMLNFTYLVGSRSTREVVVVEPAWDIDGLLDHIAERDYTLTAALATHYHPDHIGGGMGSRNIAGITDLQERNPVKVYAHRDEADGVRKVTTISESDMVKVDSGDTLERRVRSRSSSCTRRDTRRGRSASGSRTPWFSGDTLFIDGCGRVDLPGSDTEQMYHSLQKLKALPDDTLLLPGHNYSSVPNATLGETKRMNAYLAVKDLPTWKQVMGGT